jgi:hypothetical protein
VHGDSGLGVFRVRKKANYGPGGFERNGLAAAEDVRRVVPGINVGEDIGAGIVLGVEKGGVAVIGRSVVDRVVDAVDETGEVALVDGACCGAGGDSP